ncbi:MAG: hypothetical protein K2K79_07005 [Paramuribaculum sp.]|nr:hypothetical protein [Paramuribaculum sp.]
MIKKQLLSVALSTIALAASAQWTLSGGHVGDRQFTEKSSGVYELSLPGDTIYGRFLLKNGDNIRYGATNTYVCGGVAYTLASEGDSLMMASSIASPVLTLDTNAGTLTASGDVQPLYLFGNFKGNYYKIYKDVSPEAYYEGNGIYKATDVQMHGNDLTVCQIVSPPSLIGVASGDFIAPYRFSAVERTLKWDEPAAMEPCVRLAEKNFSLPEYFALIDVTINMVDVTFEATPVKLFNFDLEKFYAIGSNISNESATSRWTDTGCTTGLLMDRTEEDGVITFSLSNVAIRSTATADSEDPRGEIEFASNLGSWDEIYSGYCWGWNITTDTLTLNTNNVAAAVLRDTGKWTAPYSLPVGKYDISVTVREKAAMQFRAVQTSTSAVEAVKADEVDPNVPIEWYDLDGRRIAEPVKNGVFLRRQGQRTQKVWIFSRN